MFSTTVAATDDVLTGQYHSLRDDMPPIGCMLMHGSNTIPTNYLLCNGQSLSTTTYADLFAVIGYSFGGAGASFNVPDLRDRFPVGKSGTKAMNSTGGGTVTLAAANIPSHAHNYPTHDPHSHGLFTAGAGATIDRYDLFGSTSANTGVYQTTYDGGHDHGAVTGSTGSGTSFNVIGAYSALNYIIRY